MYNISDKLSEKKFSLNSSANETESFLIARSMTNMEAAKMIEKECQEQVDFVLARIKEERQKANMSQIELSFAAGLSQNQVNCIESGRNIPNLLRS